jgi:hypothetical protein
MRLEPVNIEQMECLMSWIRIGLVAGWRNDLIFGINIVVENQDRVQEGVGNDAD